MLHAIGDEGVPIRAVAEVIGRQLGGPAGSVAPADEVGHVSRLGAFIGADSPASSARTQELLGWRPTGPGLIEDLEGCYFRAPVGA